MGSKGDKNSKNVNLVAESLVERLSSIEGISSKKMFGGHGVFHLGKMFGIIDTNGIAFLKVNDDTKQDFENLGGQQHNRMPYYSIPEQILSDSAKLIDWVKRSIELSKE